MQRTGASILVAEDNPANRHMFTEFLTSIGHETAGVGDGQEALELMARQAFDLVIMDIQMPRLDGLEAVRRLRAGACGEAASRIPVLALTAYDVNGDRERFLAAGMSGYLRKPVSLDALEAAVARYVPSGVGEAAGASRTATQFQGSDLGRPRQAREAFAPLMKEFVAYIRERVAAAGAYLADGELELAARAGHDVKGTSMAFGVEKLSPLGARLEKAARGGDTGEAAKVVGELYAILAELEGTKQGSPRVPETTVN
jgi:CheY-like chemotaxis protein/HPt (histidine-containing phosphotransfer) domain-containing protein